MIISYASEIKQLVDTLVDYLRDEASISDVRRSYKVAYDFSKGALAKFLFGAKPRVREEESEKIYNRLKAKLEERIQILERLNMLVTNGLNQEILDQIKCLEDASVGVFEISVDFDRIQSRFERLSPLPFFDEYLKLCVAVKRGYEEAKVLMDRMPLVLMWKQKMEDDYYTFKTYYPEEEHIYQSFRESLNNLQLGIGAIQTFIDSGDPEDLDYAMRFISVTTREIREVMVEIDQAQKNKGLSTIPLLDYFLRAAKFAQQGIMPLNLFAIEVKGVKAYLNELYADLDKLEDDMPLNLSVEEDYIPQLNAIFENVDSLIGEIGKSSGSQILEIAQNIEKGIRSFMDLQAEYMRVALNHKNLQADVELSELQQAVIGLNKGMVALITLEEILNRQINRFETLLVRTSNLERNRDLNEVVEDLTLMLEGLSVLTSYFDDFDKSYLSEGLEMVEEAFEGVLKAEEIIADFESKAMLIKCLKCGAENTPGKISCYKCAAPLPATESNKQQFQSMANVALLKGNQGEMEEILVLEDLIKRIESGEDVDQELQKVVESFDKKITDAINKHEKFYLPSVKKNADDIDLKTQVERYDKILGDFQRAADGLLNYLEDSEVDLVSIEESIDIMRAAQKDLKELMDKNTKLLEVGSVKNLEKNLNEEFQQVAAGTIDAVDSTSLQ